MSYSHRGECSISGIGATDFSRKSGRSVVALASEAATRAIADAGLERSDIDGLVRSDYDAVQHNDLAYALGMDNISYWGATGVGGAAPCGMVAQAVAAIVSGQATNVLVYRALNGRSGLRFGRGTAMQQAAGAPRLGGGGSYDEYFLPYGLLAPGQMFALIAQRHMYEFGTTSDDLGRIAVAVRQRANSNPAAMMYERPMTMDDYRQSRVISSPLRLFDYCLESDGACAVVVTSTERARDAPKAPAVIRAVAQSGSPDVQGGKTFPALMRPTITTYPSKYAADRLYARAGLGPADIDVAQIYDCFTITVLLELEDYGFCAKGEGGPFASSGALDPGGSLPINTAGGNLSEAYIHGMNHVLEGVRQIRGESVNQVAGASTCLVTSGIPPMTSALILAEQ
ncbi:lipid-transfer protein [Jatrophihabitans sp.]|uniref:thiolase C-terminal domain-containing protein n=1 Tax=Jatrophihabitans sp. TaxID=1932789 RepID=UPI0030C6E4DC|nr:lipid-transfer protein [Jatrophihabitans sp.]